MITDALANAERYFGLHPGFEAAFAFLRRPGIARLVVGRHEVAGARLCASVGRDQGRGRRGARLEAHRRYIDIQFTVEGAERIGWSELASCRAGSQGYDAERDLEFFEGKPARWIDVPPGHFAVFFPEDAHAPLAGRGAVHKVVVKVAVAAPPGKKLVRRGGMR